MLFVREDIPSKLLSVENSPTEIFAEVSIRKKKWLFSCSYNPNGENMENHLETLSKNLVLYSSSYENLIIIGDFNTCLEEISMSGFCDTFGLKSLKKKLTCYKNQENSSSTDLILTNNPLSFQNSCVIETGLSDFHRMVVTVMKISFERLKPRVYKLCRLQILRKQIISRRIIIWTITFSFRGKCRWSWRVFSNVSKNSKSPCPRPTKVCTGQPFAIYEQNPFKSNSA